MTDDAVECLESPRRPERAASTGPVISILGTLGLISLGIVLFGAGSNRSVAQKTSCRALLKGHDCPVFSLSWSPDGQSLAVSGFGPMVKLWDLDSGRVSTIEGGTEQPRVVLGWSDDGRQLILGGTEVLVESWALKDEGSAEGRKVTRPESREGRSMMIAKARKGGVIRVHGTIDSRSAWLPSSGHTVVSVAFSPDGHSIVTAENDQCLRIWDAESGKLRQTLRDDNRGMSCVEYSPDGSKIVSGGGGALHLWDATSGKLLKTLGRSVSGSAVVGFSPDGKRLAAAGWDGAIQIWDLSTGIETLKLSGHEGHILALAWSPDGKSLATGGYDSTIKLWDVEDPVQVTRVD